MIELLAEATVNVCVLVASCAAIDAPEVYPSALAADVLAGAEQTIALTERNPLAAPESGAFVLADLIELYVRVRAGLSGLLIAG